MVHCLMLGCFSNSNKSIDAIDDNIKSRPNMIIISAIKRQLEVGVNIFI